MPDITDIIREHTDRSDALDYKALGRDKWREARHEVDMSLKAALAKLHPTTVPEEIWRKAWEDGHSEGYYRVAHGYEELAELVAEAELRSKGL